MERKIVKTIMTYEYLDLEEIERNKLGLEIQDFTEPNFSSEEVERITNIYYEKLKDFKGIKAMHGPFLDLKPASPDKDISELSIKKYLKALEIATRLDLDYVVFHSQINPNHIEEFVRDLNLRQNADSFREIVARAKDFKGTIVVENVFEKEPKILKDLLDLIDLDNIKVNLDIGHAKLGEVGLEDWVRTLGDYIVYSHIHTNDGKYDRHLPITKKEYDNYRDILKKYGLDPVISLEYKIDKLDKEMEKFI